MHMHATQAMQALDAGKHVLSEVIAATNINELFWLKEKAEKTDKVYMMCENYCYRPDSVLAKRLVQEGFFGDLYFAETEYISKTSRAGSKRPDGKSSWRQTWQVGKRGAFYPTHCLGPIMKCFGDDHIAEVSCFGVGPHTRPPNSDRKTPRPPSSAPKRAG